jgi:hypothetical protein
MCTKKRGSRIGSLQDPKSKRQKVLGMDGKSAAEDGSGYEFTHMESKSTVRS